MSVRLSSCIILSTALCGVAVAHASEGNFPSYYQQGFSEVFERTLTVDDISFCDDVNISCQNLVSESKSVEVSCDGGGSSGGWSFDSSSLPEDSLQCFESIDICDNNGYCITWNGSSVLGDLPEDTEVSFYPWGYDGVTVPATFSRCDSGTGHSSDTEYKEHCVWDSGADADSSPRSKRVNNVDDASSLASGLTGHTGDDMFRIGYSAAAPVSGYIEYLDIDETDPARLQYIERSTSLAMTSMALVLPAGPKGTYTDYRGFVASPPLAEVSTKNGCYPVKARVGCDADLPDLNGSCGAQSDLDTLSDADWVEIHSGNIANYGTLCAQGFPTNIVSTVLGTTTWTCQSIGDSASPEDCLYSHAAEDAMCGDAHGETFADAGALAADGEYCASGTLTGITGDGPWDWTCQADTPEGAPASCSADIEEEVCEGYYEDKHMLFVQDLSVSFDDDLPNTVAALNSLFSDPDFAEWDVGLTSTYGADGDPSVYHNELGWTNVTPDKDQIIAKVNSYTVDASEDPIYAGFRAIEDFYPRTDGQGGVVIMITDESDPNRVDMIQDFEDSLRANDLELILLLTSGVQGWYQTMLDVYDMNDIATIQTITSDSSNLADALINGLEELGCD